MSSICNYQQDSLYSYYVSGVCYVFHTYNTRMIECFKGTEKTKILTNKPVMTYVSKNCRIYEGRWENSVTLRDNSQCKVTADFLLTLARGNDHRLVWRVNSECRLCVQRHHILWAHREEVDTVPRPPKSLSYSEHHTWRVEEKLKVKWVLQCLL